MPSSSTKKKFGLTALLTALFAAGTLGTLAWQYRHPRTGTSTVASAPAPAAPQEQEATPPAPPGTEVVPPEESETDRGPAAASPAGPTLSFARAQGLHLAPDPLKLNSSVALLVDQTTGEVLVHKNDQVVLPIASLTKLMTTLLVVEAKQPMDEVLTITDADVDTERHSRSRLRVGTQLTRDEALRLALMSSENRAAHALARAYPGGLDKMVAAMNAKAKALGMKNTTYLDPTGLSNRNQSTARDLAVLVGAASRNPLIREYSTTPSHLATLSGRTLQYINSNRLVRSRKAGWDIELQKTGYIVEAGRCLTMLTKVADHNLIMVLLDSDSNGARVGDAERMRRWVTAQWGVPEAVAAKAPKAQSADEEPVRKVTDTKKKSRHARKVQAKKKDGGDDKKTEVAAKSPAKKKSKSAVAKKADDGKKDDGKKEGRVHQTFAADKSGQKS